MFSQLVALLKPSPFAEPIKDQSEVDSQYKYWRMRICYSLFFGYAIFYFTRKSFTFVAPAIAAEFDYSKFQIGLIGLTLYISYGISKFLCGVKSDRSNPRYFMAFGLIATGFINILFGLSSNLWLFCAAWGLNGFFQAWGWPACTKSLTYWFNQSNRGFWYSVTSTSHNVGGALIPLIALACAAQLGWRFAMFVPAVISILMGLWLINRLRDIPQSLGLPAVENENDLAKQKEAATKPSILSAKEIMFSHVLNNKYVWLFAINYFFVYVVRTAVNDWSIFYLQEMKGLTEIVSGLAVSGFEIGGLVGVIAAGWGSDYFFKGNRVPVMIISALGLILAVSALWASPVGKGYIDVTIITLIGFFVFGPQMIVGLAAAEFVDKRAAAASNGFAGTLGYFGAAFATAGIGLIIDQWGWNGFYWCLMASSVIIFALLVPFWHLSNPQTKTASRRPNKVAPAIS